MSLCNFPTIALPQVPDIITPIINLLASLGISVPALPTIPLPPPPCPLDY